MGARALGALALAAFLAAAFPAAAERPVGGMFRPGHSLAGIELGMTKAEVLARWGDRHGVCRECTRTTWYFNERPFRPQGMGVVFEGGLVVRAFTVWQPDDWRTPEGLALGAPAAEIGATYGELTERRCARYVALVRDHPTTRSVFYVFEEDVWGFGLARAGASPCV